MPFQTYEPRPVDAIRWDGTDQVLEEIKDRLPEREAEISAKVGILWIPSQDPGGRMTLVNPGDWLLIGANGATTSAEDLEFGARYQEAD